MQVPDGAETVVDDDLGDSNRRSQSVGGSENIFIRSDKLNHEGAAFAPRRQKGDVKWWGDDGCGHNSQVGRSAGQYPRPLFSRPGDEL